MDTSFVETAVSGWASVPWAVAAVAIAFLFFRYRQATSQMRFQAKEAKAVREDAERVQNREDRLKREERSASITAERLQFDRAEAVARAEANRVRLKALHEEARADSAGNAACAGETMRILGEADAILVMMSRYYVVRDESIDPNDEDSVDPLANLGDLQKEISDCHGSALQYFAEAQDMVKEGLYIVAKQLAENCLLEAKYASDRIIALDTTNWNSAQAEVR